MKKNKETINLFIAFKLGYFEFCRSITLPLEKYNSMLKSTKENNKKFNTQYMLELLIPCLIGEAQYNFAENGDYGYVSFSLALFLKIKDEPNEATNVFEDRIEINIYDEDEDTEDTLYLSVITHDKPIEKHGAYLYEEFKRNTDAINNFHLN